MSNTENTTELSTDGLTADPISTENIEKSEHDFFANKIKTKRVDYEKEATENSKQFTQKEIDLAKKKSAYEYSKGNQDTTAFIYLVYVFVATFATVFSYMATFKTFEHQAIFIALSCGAGLFFTFFSMITWRQHVGKKAAIKSDLADMYKS